MILFLYLIQIRKCMHTIEQKYLTKPLLFCKILSFCMHRCSLGLMTYFLTGK